MKNKALQNLIPLLPAVLGTLVVNIYTNLRVVEKDPNRVNFRNLPFHNEPLSNPTHSELTPNIRYGAMVSLWCHITQICHPMTSCDPQDYVLEPLTSLCHGYTMSSIYQALDPNTNWPHKQCYYNRPNSLCHIPVMLVFFYYILG